MRAEGHEPGRRRERWASGRFTTKPIPTKGAERRPGGCARKAAELTPGGLHRVAGRRLRASRGVLSAVQKSAEGIVPGRSGEGPNGWRVSMEWIS